MTVRTTKIEWTERTWKFLYGCDAVSPGCAKCYAMWQAANRLKNNEWYDGTAKMVDGHAKWTGVVKVREDALTEPLTWREPGLCFVNNMSDTFHTSVPRDVLDVAHLVMCLAHQSRFQILTKRSAEMREYYTSTLSIDRFVQATDRLNRLRPGSNVTSGFGFAGNWNSRNIWKGVSCEDKARRYRIDDLRNTPAAIRFVSFEPLLEDLGDLNLDGIHWAIFGGESGFDKPRPCHINWIRRAVEQCRAQGVKVFVKQLGTNAVWVKGYNSVQPFEQTHPKGGDPAEWPEDLRIREMPEVAA